MLHNGALHYHVYVFIHVCVQEGSRDICHHDVSLNTIIIVSRDTIGELTSSFSMYCTVVLHQHILLPLEHHPFFFNKHHT